MELFTGISQSPVEYVIVSFLGESEFILPLHAFILPHEKRLSKLALEYGLSRLQPHVFRNLTNLYRIEIHVTGIREIAPCYFDGMSGLRVLDLGQNEIASFNPNASVWNIYITELYLNSNNILVLPKGAFRGLKYLLVLDLSNNILTQSLGMYISSSLLSLNISRTGLPKTFNFPNLQRFSFSGRLKDPTTNWSIGLFFMPNRFRQCLYLLWIQIDNSGIKLANIWNENLNESIFGGLHYIQFIDLSNNKLSTLPQGLFPNLSMLSYLNLTNCRISVIETGVFSDLRSLNELHLDHNLIFQLPHNLFQSEMKYLQLVSLNSNLLEYLAENLFVNTPNISTLDLSRNLLATFNQRTFVPVLSTLKFIDLSENPILCSCQMKWLIHLGKSAVHIQRVNQTMCSFVSDLPFRGRPVFAIDPNQLCTSHLALFCTLPLIAVGFIGVVYLVYIKRLLIKYKIFLLKLAFLGYDEIQDPCEHFDCEFDLNIIHVDEDKEWVEQLLGPILRDMLPHYERIALTDEDLPLGMYYLDAVLYVIEHSFKTVLLLSRAATHDHEFMMKLRTALNHVTNTRTLSTLLVFLEDIADDELPHLVKLYLSEERPYICWIEDERGQIYFWKKLIKMLKVNLRCNDMIPPE